MLLLEQSSWLHLLDRERQSFGQRRVGSIGILYYRGYTRGVVGNIGIYWGYMGKNGK